MCSARARLLNGGLGHGRVPLGLPGGNHQRHMPPPCDFGSDDEPRRAMICRQTQRNSPRREGCGSGPGSSPCSGSGADSSRMEPPRTGGMGRGRAHRTSTSLALHNGGPNGSRLSAVRLFVFVDFVLCGMWLCVFETQPRGATLTNTVLRTCVTV